MEKGDAVRDCIALAKEVGIELAETDFVDKEACSDLSENELEAVAGGLLEGSDTNTSCISNGTKGGHYHCILSGGIVWD